MAFDDFKVADPKTWMVEMSGTSMAAPHVSGLIAGFLSVRREFIGWPPALVTGWPNAAGAKWQSGMLRRSARAA